MIFETLHESSKRGELLLIDGGMCHWHLRKDSQLTIREIIATEQGAGTRMLNYLLATKGANSLFAKCPAELESNEWYARKGFICIGTETTKSGKVLNLWQYTIDTHKPRRNTKIELIYCAAGNRRLAKIALLAGWLYGAQLPNTVYHRPYFVDQDWKNPVRADYMASLREYRPRLATVLDLEHEHQFDEVMDWAQEASQYVGEVIIIPKVAGIIERIPREINGKPIRLGYSVPTKYGGTIVPLYEFGQRPVHLLGGHPRKQFGLASVLNVASVDCNLHQMVANYGKVVGAQSDYQLREETPIASDVPYQAFARSCQNIYHMWQPRQAKPPRVINNQMSFWDI